MDLLKSKFGEPTESMKLNKRYYYDWNINNSLLKYTDYSSADNYFNLKNTIFIYNQELVDIISKRFDDKKIDKIKKIKSETF